MTPRTTRTPRWLALVAFLATLAAAVAFFRWRSQRPERQILSLYIWAEYMDPKVIEDFERENNVTVVQDNYPSNEAMMSKLQAGADGYDVIVPTDYVVAYMAAQGMLAPLDHAQLPNRRYLDPAHAKPSYDPTGRYTVPYLFGTTGIAYDSSAVSTPPKTWAQFFSEATLHPLGQRVSLLDDSREVLGAALKSLGQSINTLSRDDLARALAVVQGIRPFIGRFDTMSYKDLLASGDLVMAHAYSGEALRLGKLRPEIRYLIPAEGGTLYTDNLAIPSSSKHKALAHTFINYLHRPEISARLATTLQYGTPNLEARGMLPAEDLANPYLYPSAEILQKLERMEDLGELAEVFEDAWITLRAADLQEEEDAEEETGDESSATDEENSRRSAEEGEEGSAEDPTHGTSDASPEPQATEESFESNPSF